MAKAAIQTEVKKTRKVAPPIVVDAPAPKRTRIAKAPEPEPEIEEEEVLDEEDVAEDEVEEEVAPESVYETMYAIALKNDAKFGGRHDQEKEQVFLRRFVESLSEEISDAAYKSLPTEGAKWLSQAVDAINTKKPVPTPPGYTVGSIVTEEAPAPQVRRTRQVPPTNGAAAPEATAEAPKKKLNAGLQKHMDAQKAAKAAGKAPAPVVKKTKVEKVAKADKDTSAALGGVELIRRYTIENEGCSNEDIASYLVSMGLPNVAPATISVTKGGTLATMAWLRKLDRLAD